jgi:hypothetical protein
MKTFRVSLSVGGVVFVEADRFESDGTMIRFYRGDTLTAEYACASVKEEVLPATATQRIGLFAPRGSEPAGERP